jgi:hypothetical protein
MKNALKHAIILVLGTSVIVTYFQQPNILKQKKLIGTSSKLRQGLQPRAPYLKGAPNLNFLLIF